MATSWPRLIARQRRGLGRALTRASTSRLVAGMPKNGIESLEKFLWRADIKRHVVRYVRLREAKSVKYDFRLTFPTYFRRRHTFADRRLYHLRDVTVSPFTGLVWTKYHVLTESLGSCQRIMDWSLALDDALLPVKSLSDPRLMIACPSLGFYHWLLETLPNIIAALEQWDGLIFLAPSDAPRYVRDGLSFLLSGDDSAARILCVDQPVRVANLALPGVDAEGGFLHPEDLSLLRRTILPTARMSQVCAAPSTPNIYVSRRRTPMRPLLGEALLEAALSARGFRIIHAEALSLAEQIVAFADARAIVAPHGAGLSHLVWTEPPCRVVEVFRPDYVNDCFATLASSRGLDYDYVMCRTAKHHIDEALVDEVLSKLDTAAP